MMIVDILCDGASGKYAPYAAMATAIITYAQRYGQCQPADLLQAGFTADDIEQRWHMADAMAAIELKLMQQQV